MFMTRGVFAGKFKLGDFLFNGGKTGQNYIKITRENIFRRYSARRKSFETGIVPVSRHSYPLSRLSINCSNIVNTNHPIETKHFHMVCTKYILLPMTPSVHNEESASTSQHTVYNKWSFACNMDIELAK